MCMIPQSSPDSADIISKVNHTSLNVFNGRGYSAQAALHKIQHCANGTWHS